MDCRMRASACDGRRSSIWASVALVGEGVASTTPARSVSRPVRAGPFRHLPTVRARRHGERAGADLRVAGHPDDAGAPEERACVSGIRRERPARRPAPRWRSEGRARRVSANAETRAFERGTRRDERRATTWARERGNALEREVDRRRGPRGRQGRATRRERERRGHVARRRGARVAATAGGGRATTSGGRATTSANRHLPR